MERGETSDVRCSYYYDVFLSFRGPDTRQGLISCLYGLMTRAGIRVFKDDRDLLLGDEIRKILEEIGNSKMCIAVFSKNYASSKWCLLELAEMVKLQKRIIPIFYDVKPHDVKGETGLYAKALGALHKQDLRVEEWKAALKKVGGTSGKELKDMGYIEFCESIISMILPDLKIKEKEVTKHLVEIRDHTVNMLEHLKGVDGRDVTYVGIHGIIGIGKTTLAKVFYNQLSDHFEYCSFLSDIKNQGIKDMQKQLLSDLGSKSREIRDSDDGIKSIRDVCRNKKVLIVLDHVSKKKQIDKLAGNSSWFGSGSRIIVTSRDKSVLEYLVCTSEHPKRVRTLEMRLMNEDESLQLFSLHAFNKVSPAEEHIELAKKAVSSAGYLPLSLEFMGSSLGRLKIDDWEKEIERLQTKRHMDLRRRLMKIYENLQLQTTIMFLDIACFLVNREKTNAIYMWKACGLDPYFGIEELVDWSIMKIVDNKFWMYDDLMEFGREKVMEENQMVPGKQRSRLWKYEEALEMLKEGGEGTENVQAICPESLSGSREDLDFTSKSSKNFNNLRFLGFLHNKTTITLKLKGDFKGHLSNLRWLSCCHCPKDLEATGLNLRKLVVLDLSHSSITGKWDGWRKITIGKSLKVLDLSHCQNLEQTPDLSMYDSLEKLILEGCLNLQTIDSSIGRLKTLKHLNVKHCKSLVRLPDSLGKLKSLVELDISDSGIREWPESIGSLIRNV